MVGMRDDPGHTLVGNERYEGVSVEIFEEAVKVMASKGRKFKYKFYSVPDGHYGRKDETTNQWNGVFGELKKGVRPGVLRVTRQGRL